MIVKNRFKIPDSNSVVFDNYPPTQQATQSISENMTEQCVVKSGKLNYFWFNPTSRVCQKTTSCSKKEEILKQAGTELAGQAQFQLSCFLLDCLSCKSVNILTLDIQIWSY